MSEAGIPHCRPQGGGPFCATSAPGYTDSCILKLPPEKLGRLNDLTRQWRSCTKRELLSLIGHLSHACRVVRAGRTFLRRMIDLSSVPKELHHRVRLNKGFQSDLHWWVAFLEGWNGVSMFGGVVRQQPSAVLTSDASGSWGCGA
jgi:hypothetical protein